MKKFLSILILISLILSLFSCGAREVSLNKDDHSDRIVYKGMYDLLSSDSNQDENEPTAYQLGDVNKDGTINNVDLLLLFRYIYNPVLYPLEGTPEEDTTPPATDDNPEDDLGEFHPEISQKNYNEDFYMTVMSHVNEISFYWVDDSGNNSLSNAIYDRQNLLENYLGVTMYATTSDDLNEYITAFQTAVKNKDDSIHMTLSHTFMGIDGFITSCYLTDFSEMSELNLSADYWNYDFMDEISVKDHMYLGYSDFNIARTNVVAFNKDIYSQYMNAIGEDIYDIVNDYRWTFDQMTSMANLVYVDQLSDGKTEDDIFGLVGDYEVPYASLLQACNIKVVEQNENGEYNISIYNEKNKAKTSSLVDKLYELVRSDSVMFFDIDYNIPAKIFTDNRSLMYLARTTSLPGFLNDDVNFGVVPYPMYDEAQANVGYRSLHWGGYICVPSYLSNPDMVGETIELLSYASDDVNIAYYEKLLGKQVADAPKDKRMLDIVWDSVCSDFGLTYSKVTDKDFHYMMLHDLTAIGSSGNLASYIASNEYVANKRLAAFIKAVK